MPNYLSHFTYIINLCASKLYRLQFQGREAFKYKTQMNIFLLDICRVMDMEKTLKDPGIFSCLCFLGIPSSAFIYPSITSALCSYLQN